MVAAVRDYSAELPVLGLPGSAFLRAAEKAGLRTVGEFFVDRGYTPEGALVPRSADRPYLAIRGGIDVAPVLGSRSTDTLSGIGPPPLQVGDVLPVGPEPAALPVVDLAPVRLPPGDTVVLRAVLGPARRLRHRPDRADGYHLDGVEPQRPHRHAAGGREAAAGRRRRDAERGDGPGAIQVPPGGEPVVFLADHPVTGGYPVVATVCDADVDVDRAAQVRPGQGVRFVVVPPATVRSNVSISTAESG